MVRNLRARSIPRPVASAFLLLLASTSAWAAKPDQKPITIPIEPLGFQLIPMRFQSTGSTMFTVHFIDEQHLLFTFNKRSLMPRLPDADPLDDDRNVEAVLLDLPSGHVLARTQWRLRDRDRYLWPLEHGRFLLRQRSKLSVIDPLRSFERDGAAGAFRQAQFLELTRPIGYMTVSPGGDLLGIETIPPRKPKLTGAKADAAALAATVAGYKPPPQAEESGNAAPVQIHFFRLITQNADGSGKLIVQAAGIVGAPNLISLPATGEGYLDVKRESGRAWDFDFVSHSGKRSELSGYETSCAPRPYWISRSEFVAFGCRGANEKQELSYFNLKGEQPWLAVLPGLHVSPSIVAAPASGRFALSRTLVTSTIFDLENLTADDLSEQAITVHANSDGRVLLKVSATPIQRAGQNFDLSPSGNQFVVLRGGNLEIYRLPPLTGKDEKNLQVAAAAIPEKNQAIVRMGAVTNSTSADATSVVAPPPANPSSKPAPPLALTSMGDSVVAVPAVAKPAAPAALPAAPAALPAADALQTESHAAPTQQEGAPEILGDQPMGGVRKTPPSLYTPDHPRVKGDAPPATSTEPK